MPIYEYKCTECAEKLVLSRPSDERDVDLPTCKTCGSEVKRVYSSIGIAFKGSGFYSTDK